MNRQEENRDKGAAPLDYLTANVGAWETRGTDQRKLARRQWSATEPSWGIFETPEAVARILPERIDDLDVVELGCGTAYVSAWLARRGARPVGVDPTPGQLLIARVFQDEFALRFPLIRAAAEQLPLRDESFDLAISEYGAAIWADPYRWIPEASRVLRPGGLLVFLGNSVVLMLCVPDEEDEPATDSLRRAQFGMHRFEWPDDPSVEFRRFVIEDLLELRPLPGSTSEYRYVTPEWASRWPCEEVWRARKVGVR